MDNCIFCKIAARTIPAEIIYEDDACVAFLDIRPRSPGHAMVIPKKHARDLLELAPELVGPLFLGVKRAAEKIKNALKPDGFTYGINQGRASGQEVDHLHIHIIPRYHDDAGGPIQIVVDNPPKEELKLIAKKIIDSAQK